ncbi:hypothetical protein Fcan01_09059 [Folsomia candida]|uniref:Uncharacterized protein n=1 Tax=Folsomia candida TaxID=158441 RepID=A0A226EE65_FOLCA|nr:hypothetical protein Fcan01_09059 [Folsomia candida]
MTENLEKALKNTGLIQYKDKFQENDVDDTIFFKLLDSAAGSVEERLLAEIIPSVGHRFKLISAGRELDKQTFETDQRALGDMPDVILGNSSDIDSGSRHRLPNESGPEVEISFLSFDPLFDIKQIILSSDQEKGTKKGEKILQECLESNAITFEVKSLIKRRIVNYLVKQYTYFPPKNVKQNLAEFVAAQLFQNLRLEQQRDIVNLFYRESRIINYKSDLHKRTPASGLIEDRLKYLRRKHQCGRASIPKVVSSLMSESPWENEQEKKSWLCYSSTPFDQVAEYMAQTFRLSQWPRLIDTPGMIDQDFSARHPGVSETMLHKWASISKQIWKFAKNAILDVPREIGIIHNISDWSEEQINIGSLIVLPYLLSKSAYTKGSKKRRKITAGQSSEFFIQFVKSNDDLEEFRMSESLRKQPFILCVGNLKNLEIQQSYIMVERRLILAESLVKAVDMCFKIFHVLQLQFPDECSSVWCFFDHSVFRIKEIKSPSSSVLSLASQINLEDGEQDN